MKKTKKVLIAGALVLSVFAATTQNHQVSAAPSDLASNGDFEELKTSNIGSYTGTPSEMDYGTWYTRNGGVVSYTGYNESERSGMLPGNAGDTWLGQAIKVEKNTDYVFSAYIKTSLAKGNAALEILDADLNVIDQYWIGGTEWQEGKITFNSGDRDRIVIRVLKRSDDDTSDVYKSEVYVDNAKLFTKADYEAEYGQKPLGEFVRELVGLDMNAAKEAFADYLNDVNLDSRQIYFVNQIVEYIVHNGMMKDFSVLQEAPFTDQGSIVDVFTDMNTWFGIRKVIETINNNAMVA